MKYLKSFENNTLDKILDKISEFGVDSLTDNEKFFLDKFSNNEDITEIENIINSKTYNGKIGPYDATIRLMNIINNGEVARWNAELFVNDIRYIGWIEFDGEVYQTIDFQNGESDVFTDFEGLEYEIDSFCQEAFYENYQINESRISDIEDKYNSKIDKKIVKYFLENDPTPNKAFFRWLCNRYEKLDNKKEGIEKTMVKMITKYKNIKTKIKEKQITRIKSVKELSKILNRDGVWNKLDKNVILYEDMEWVIFTPTTEEITEQYGNLSWCVVYDYDEFNEKYFVKDGALTFCINKLNMNEDFAIEQTDNGKANVWDNKDVKILEDKKIESIAQELIKQGYISESDMTKKWKSIKIKEAKMTQTRFNNLLIKKLKSMGVRKISEIFGTDIIFSYENEVLHNETDKLLIKTIRKNEENYLGDNLDDFIYDNQMILENDDISIKLKYIFGVDVMLNEFNDEIIKFLNKFVDWKKIGKTIINDLTMEEIRDAINF